MATLARSHMTHDERARELWETGTKRLSEDQVEEPVKLFEQTSRSADGRRPHLSRMGRFRT